MEIQVKNLDHLGIVAGIVDQIGLVEEIDRLVEPHPQQIISTGQVVTTRAFPCVLHRRGVARQSYDSQWIGFCQCAFIFI